MLVSSRFRYHLLLRALLFDVILLGPLENMALNRMNYTYVASLVQRCVDAPVAPSAPFGGSRKMQQMDESIFDAGTLSLYIHVYTQPDEFRESKCDCSNQSIRFHRHAP
jgi:hypothetical protein